MAVKKGSYKIEDGILSYNVTDWKILNDSVKQMPFLISYPKYKLLMTGELLYFYPLDILVRTENKGSDIWGSWSTSQWTIGYSPNKQNPLTLEELKWKFCFNQDSMTVTYGSKFSDQADTVLPFTTEKISYAPPNLSWGLYFNKTIEFHDDQMYMFQKLESKPVPLKKMIRKS